MICSEIWIKRWVIEWHRATRELLLDVSRELRRMMIRKRCTGIFWG